MKGKAGMKLIISEDHEGATVRHMALKVARISESSFRSMKFSGGILLDGNVARANERVKCGQVLSFRFHDAPVLPVQKNHGDNVVFVYEDEDLEVIAKPAPLPTMASAKQAGDTLESRYVAQTGRMFRPVNRLDKGTSGLMAAAKSSHAQQLMQKKLHTDEFVREYVAICDGSPAETEGVIDLPIGKESGVKRCIAADGKNARTHYQVLKKGRSRTLLHLRLETGRTHQIRVHLAAMGCPVTGDYLYGREHDLLPGRFALHSCAIRFTQPVTGQKIDLKLDMPKEWGMLLNE